MKMNMKRVVPLLLIAILLPQIAFAAWWNPFTWDIFSWIFDRQPAAVVETLDTKEVATSTDEIIATTTHETKNNVAKEPTVKPSPTQKPQVKQPTPEISKAVATTSATTSNYKDAELELIKQQNEILKQQLLAQQQIAQNTTQINGLCSVTLNVCTAGTLNDVADTSTHYLWSCKGINGGSTASCSLSVPSFEFNPIIEVGGATGYGVLHPELIDTGCLGCSLTDISSAYLTIPEGPASGSFKMFYTNNIGNISTINSYFTDKKIVKIGGVPAGQKVDWEVTASQSGYQSNTKSGSFISRSPRLVSIPEGGESNGFLFMNYGVAEKTIDAVIEFQGSGQNVEVQFLRNGQYTSTVVPVVNNGDTLALNNITHHINIRSINGSAPWTDNQSVKFKIISASAKDANGNPIEFYY